MGSSLAISLQWATPLRTKDQVLSVFKELHARVERESGRKLKAVRADNGGEYRGQFEEYYCSKGIRPEFTVLKTPELNGLAEGMNRPCIFLGYGDNEFGYRVWDPVDKKVFRSRDIILMEDKTTQPTVTLTVSKRVEHV